MQRMTKLLFGAVLAALAAQPATAKDKVTYGYLLDPSHEAVMWAIHNGKVASDKIEIEARALQVPALIQATGTKQFDVIETAVPSIALAGERGLKLVIVSTALRMHKDGLGADIWVKADSPIRTARDLKGKTLAVYALGGSGVTLTRIVLNKKYGYNVALDGGDLKFVELPAPAVPGAILTGRVDAGVLIHTQAHAAEKGKDLRAIGVGQSEMYEVLGSLPITAVNVSYPEKLAARADAIKEFNRMLRESARYALSNKAEVFGAVAKKYNMEADFFEVWFSRYSQFPAAISDEDLKSIAAMWAHSKELGIIRSFPDVKSVIWEHAIRE
jgi:NitT/TauT family transport system substrate-binding protein